VNHGNEKKHVNPNNKPSCDAEVLAQQVLVHRYQQEDDAGEDGIARYKIMYDEYGNPCDYMILELNAVYAACTGWNINSVIGIKMSELICDGQKTFIQQLNDSLRNNTASVFDYYSPTLDRYYRGEGYQTSDGEYIRILSDITAERKIQASLREELTFKEKVAQLVPAYIYINDCVNVKTIWSNKGFEKILGYTREEWLALTPEEWGAMFHPDDMAFIYGDFEDFKNRPDGTICAHEYRTKHKDGRWMWGYAAVAHFKRDENGRLLQSIGVHIDINDIKAAEETTRLQKEMYERLLAMMPVVVCKCDENFTINLMNHTGVLLFGCTKDKQCHFGKFLAQGESYKIFTKLKQQQLCDLPIQCLTQCVTVTGESIDVILTAIRITESEAPASYLLSLMPLQDVVSQTLLPDNTFYLRYDFTVKEKEIVELLLKGYSRTAIMKSMAIAEGTLKKHIYNIFIKMDISSMNALFENVIEYLKIQYDRGTLVFTLLKSLIRK